MAGEIKTRISLVGGDQVKKAFADLGNAGAKAAQDIQKAFNVQQNVGAFTNGLKTVGQGFDNLGRSTLIASRAIGNFATTLQTPVRFLAGLAAGLGVVQLASGAAFVSMAKGATEAADAVKKVTLETKVAADSFNAFRLASAAAGGTGDTAALGGLFKQITDALKEIGGNLDPLDELARKLDFNGVRVSATADEFSRGLTTIRNGIKTTSTDVDGLTVTVRSLNAEGAKGGPALSPLAEALVRLRSAVDPTTGRIRDTEAALRLFIDTFSKLPAAVQNDLGLKLFKDNFAELQPLLTGGTAAIDAATAKLRELGLVISDADQKTLTAAQGAFRTLGVEAELLKAKLTVIVTPALLEGLRAFEEVLKQNGDTLKTALASGVQTAIGLIRDLVAVLNGDRAQNQTFQSIVDGIRTVGTSIQTVYSSVIKPAADAIGQALNGIATAFNAVFGTNVNATDVAVALLFANFLGGIRLVQVGLQALIAVVGLFGSTVQIAFGLIRAAIPLVSTALLGLRAAFAALPGLVSAAATAAASALTTAFTVAVAGVRALFTGIGPALAAALTGAAGVIRAAAATAFAGIAAAARVAALAAAALFTPQGLLGLAIVAGIAAIAALTVTYWPQISEGAAKAWEAIKASAASLWTSLGELWTRGATALGAAFDTVATRLGEAFAAVGGFIGRAIDLAVEKVASLGSVLADLASKVGSLFSSSAQAAPAAQQPRGVTGLEQVPRDLDTIRAQGEATFGALTAAGQQSVSALVAAFAELANQLTVTWALITDQAQQAFTGIVDIAANVFGSISDALASVASTDIFAALVNAVQTAFAAIQQAAVALGDAVGSALEGGAQRAVAAVEAAVQQIVSAIESAIQRMEELIARAREAIAAANEAASAGGGGGGGDFAMGGRITGPGTSTSDSIPIWASTGEFMIRAAAVRKYGAGLFDALNAMRLPRGGLRFARGGSIGRAVPKTMAFQRFAGGGLIGALQSLSGLMGGSFGRSGVAPQPAMRPVVLNIGGQQMGPLMGTDEIVSRIERFSVSQQLRAAGTAPSWKR